MVKRKNGSVSWAHGRRFQCRGHANNTPASQPRGTPCPRHSPTKNAPQHRKVTPASVLLILACPNTRTASQTVRADQQGSTRSGRLNPIRRGGIFPIGCTPHRNKHVPKGGRQKPIATAAGRCTGRQSGHHKATAPTTHKYQTTPALPTQQSTQARRSGTRISPTWQLTIRIGYDDVDRLSLRG